MGTKTKSGTTPLSANRDAEKLQREIADLQALESKPFLARTGGYIKRSGPGLLQSAMTLGAGSAAASVMAGASFGYKLLWIQPLAMFLGVMMLAALGNVVLTTGERPYKAFARETNRFLIFLWALGSVIASVVWHFPQYGLAAGAARDLADLAGVACSVPNGEGGVVFTSAGLAVGIATGIVVLLVNVAATWSYGGGSWGIKLYEWFLRGVIALTIVAFGLVVVAHASDIQWAEVGKGLVGYHGIPEADHCMTLVLGMLGASVGINMTFLYPYSLLAKGWGKHHKTLARWDLGLSMFLPFVLVSSLIIIAMTVGGIYDPLHESVRTGMKPLDAAAALQGVMGTAAGRVIFDLGLISMACGAISAHMVVCGFTLCEMFHLEHTAWRFRWFALTPAVGVLGVVATLPIWFPIAASAVCVTMLPIAYLIFLVMNNKRSYLGDAVGRGAGRALFNAILVVALAVAAVGSAIQLKNGAWDPLMKELTKSAATPS